MVSFLFLVLLVVIAVIWAFRYLSSDSKKTALAVEDSNLRRLEPIFTKVAGVAYRNEATGEERQKVIRLLKVGETLQLQADTSNKFDPFALKVTRLNGQQIGFINADLAVELHGRLQAGNRMDCKVSNLFDETGVKQVLMEIQRYSRKK
jgi:HIRAN domain